MWAWQVMFFIVAGEIPFGSHRAREAAKRAILGFRPSLKQLANDVPHDLLVIIKSCWAHEHSEVGAGKERKRGWTHAWRLELR